MVFVLEVLVHGATGDSRLAYDVGDLGIIVAVFREEFLGTYEYLVSSFGCVHPVTSITGCAVTAMHWIIQGEKGLCQLFLFSACDGGEHSTSAQLGNRYRGTE